MSAALAAEPVEERRPKRAPVRVDQQRPPTSQQFQWTLDILGTLDPGFLAALRETVGEGKGRPGSVTTQGVLAAWLLRVTQEGHKAEITDVAGQLVALDDRQLAQLGMKPLPVARAYKRFHDKFSRVRKAMAEGFTYVDRNGVVVEVELDWFTETMPRAAIPKDLPSSRTVAVDGTDWETAGRFRSTSKALYDGDAPVSTDEDPEKHALIANRSRRKAKRDGWEMGPDGRAIHTTDRDCRGGYRTATNGRKGGMYVGSEVHLGVQTRDFSWSGDINRVNEGEDVPKFITHARLVPSGSHRAHSIVPALTATSEELDIVVWDRGYSMLPFAAAHGPLRTAGIQTVFDLSTVQRTHPTVTGKVDWIDGHPFHEHTPQRLRHLEVPPMNSSSAQRAEYQALFNERAKWRWSKQAGPDGDGVTRWICPFHAGRLKCRSIRQRTIGKRAPLVQLPAGVTSCCEGTLTLSAEYLNLIQAHGIPYGTTAQAQAMGRRQHVETGNSYLGGTYVDLSRTYSRLMGHANRKFVLAMLLAGLNRYIERSWRAKVKANEAAPATPTRAKRRQGTFDQLLKTPAQAATTARSASDAKVTPLRT